MSILAAIVLASVNHLTFHFGCDNVHIYGAYQGKPIDMALSFKSSGIEGVRQKSTPKKLSEKIANTLITTLTEHNSANLACKKLGVQCLIKSGCFLKKPKKGLITRITHEAR